MKLSRFLGGTVAIVGLAFGYAGGEYSTKDWRTLREDIAAEQAAIARLVVEIDSMRREVEALETDPAAQERAARERFGMLRTGELMYKIERVPEAAGRD